MSSSPRREGFRREEDANTLVQVLMEEEELGRG